MSSASRQAYLNTRVSVMATQLLEPTAVNDLVALGLPDLAERFGLGIVLDEQLTARTKSRALEQSLIQVLLTELTILVRPMNAAERAMVLAWARKYALYNLKTLIRGKLYHLEQSEIRSNLYDLPENIKLPHQELFRAENVLELLRQLEGGPHRLIARQAREVYEQKREPFALEAAIDKRYYTSLVRQVMQFHDDNLRPLQHLIGAELDRVGLLWLLRYRFSYGLSASETFYQLVPSFRTLHRERLLALVNRETFERTLESLPDPLSRVTAGSNTVVDVQKRMGAYVAREARRVLRHSPSGVARSLAYLILREMDLFMLFALVQGKLLKLSPELVDIAVELAEPTCHWRPAAAA